MADLFDPTSSRSPPPPPPPPSLPPPLQAAGNFSLESDDISSLLHNLLHNSSQPSTSSTSVHLPPENSRQFTGSAVFSEPVGFLDSSSGLNFPFAGAYYSSGTSDRTDNAFSGSIGISMEGLGEADCDSEEQEEVPANPSAPSRSSSKRSRAAEFHNLSEKRRRQRINEKMKALQKLIPNSNKTDKASMLDEAIEYLKQLQLQVQMLTMRNCSSLHPFYSPTVPQPGQLPQVASLVDVAESSKGVGGSFPTNQEVSMQAAMFDLSTKPPPSSDYKVVMPRISECSNSGPSFLLEPSMNPQYRPYNEPLPSKVICKDPAFPQLQLDMSHCGQSSTSGVSS